MRIDAEKMKKQMDLQLLNIKELAKETGLSANTISLMLNTDRQPRTTTLKKVCSVLKCTPQDIMKED